MQIPVLTPRESSDWDLRAESGGIALATLMESAGRGAAQVIATRHADRLAGGVLIAAGPGNNGGDGWVVARALHRLGVTVFVAPAEGNPSRLNTEMAARAGAEGVRTVDAEGPWPAVALLVDALLGTGAQGPLRPALQRLVERLNDLALPIVAIDGPTGLDLTTGVTHGAAVQAALSITFGGFRRGHLLARDECGEVIVVDIGQPAPDSAWPAFLTDQDAAEAQGRFSAGEHKGTRGRVVVVGGDAGMSGALRLAARAAFGAGAGLVHAVAPQPTIDLLATAEPDLQTLAHPFSVPVAPALAALLDRADVVVIGPGLGRAPGRLEFVLDAANHARMLVLDADALFALGGAVARLREVCLTRTVVVTPHQAEFRRLFPEAADGLELDPWRAAGAAAQLAGCAVLLKGVPTVVAGREGSLLTVAAGNPGLATGGSGDILSGLVATMLGQLEHPVVASAVAAQALGRAADLAARRFTARAMRPMDVLAALPDLWRSWETRRILRTPPRPPILYELEAPQRW